MGFFFSKDKITGYGKDEMSAFEKALQMKDYNVEKFTATLIEAAKDRGVRLEEMRSGFKGTEFGNKLDSSDVLKLFNHKLCKSEYEGVLDSQFLIFIGFIYAEGSYKERVNALFTRFDNNGDGSLRDQKLEMILRNAILLQGVVIPEIVLNQPLMKEMSGEVEALVKQTLNKLLKASKYKEHVTKEEFPDLLEDEISYLVKPVLLRKELRKFTQH